MKTIPVQIGENNELVLPPEVLAEIGVKAGDTIYFIPEGDHGFRVSWEPDFTYQMEVGKEIMRRDHDILAALAKS